jgi:3-oxoacyl-[acyl-carrier-protein] synthase-3
VDPADKKTFPLFGDGAGAVLLGKSETDQGLLSFALGAEGDGGELLGMPAGGTREPLSPENWSSGRQYVKMDGRAVFKWAVRLIADASQQVLQRAGMTIHDADLVVFHQANIRIIDSAVQSLGVDPDKVLVNLDRYGNTSAGSIPLVLDEANQQGRIRRGDRILLAGFGAGLSWGAGVLRW